MANKILSESFKVFTKYGYNDSIDDFVKLVNSNPDALNDAYEQYKNDAGFEGTIEEYAAALNQKPATVKKKEQEPSGMELPSEDGSSEQSTPQQPEPPKKPRTYGTLNLPGITGALRTGKPSAKELAAIGEFAKKTGTIKEKPKTTGKTPPSEGEVLSIAFQRVEQEEKEQEEVDKPKLVDPTLAAIPQKDVLRESPALTSKEQIQKKVNEAAEDAKATQQYKDKQRILTTLQFARDKEKEFEQRKEREQEAAELLASTDFNSLLNEITPGLINQEETKVASELTNRLGRFGFSFSEADPGTNSIYITAKKSGGEIPSIQINLGAEDAEQRLKNFIKQYASKPYQYTPTDRQIDIEGQQFYASRGLDYKNERARQDEYYNIRDKRIAAESIDPDDPTTYNETMRQKFPDLFTSTGAPRRDLDQLSKDLLAQEDALYATIFDKGVSRDVREQWDVELEKKRKEAAATAAIKNNAAKTAIRDLDVYLTSTLGITIDQLPKYKPKTQEEADIANEVIRKYVEAAKISKEAATQYQLSQLYFDEKVNKAVQGEYVENLEGVYKSIHDGWKEGKTGQVLTLVAEGIYDRTDIVSARDAAQIIVDAQLAKYNQQSAVMGRADAAVSTREYIDAILEDPFEYVTTLFGTSIAQMLPTFMVIAPQTVTAGAAIGGLSTRTPQGAIGGAIGGLKRAQELTEFAVEIGSSFGEAMKNNKLDILNPDDVAFALNNEAIWGETVDLGAGRGIAIALTQFVANKIAGRVFKVDDYASQAAKVGSQVTERFVVDPVTEGLGEAVAQLVSAGDIDFKEVSAEAIGGVGGNVTGMAANIYMDTQGKANIEIADNLTNIDYVANETASDERISNWANNMHRLGKIDADVNQRIQENIGHKRSAENLLKVGESKRERKDKSPLVARMMKLLAAEKELSSTEERRKVFSDKLSAIRKEQAYIADKQQLAPDDAKVDVDAIIKEQPQPGNYSYNGRRMTKAQFTERIEKMSPQKLANAVARKRLLVTGDPEVVKTINDKLNAVQKPTTKEGVLRQEGPEVELREMGERDAEGQAPQAPITYTQEEVTKRKDELTTQLEQLTKEAEAAPDDTELAGRVAEVKQQVAGMEAIGRRLETQENVKQSIKSVYPDLEVVEVNNAKEMEDYVAANVEEKTRKQMIGGEGGVIIFGADGKPESIIINNEVADSTTMPHEAWHGILFKAFGDNPELFAEFRTSIDKALRDNGFGDIADRLDQFVSEGEYAPELMAEEWLVELGGLLVSQGIDVKNLKPNEATLLQQIKDIINAFAERIIGQPVFLKDATPENILDFMVTISERMRKGESIADFFGEEGNVTKASTDIKASRKVPIEEVKTVTTPALQTVEATAKALDGVDVSKISEIVYIPQVLEVNELDKIPRGETFQEKYAPEYFAKLKEDIKNNGIKEPVTLKYYVKDNAIRLMEGHHRLKIAKELGIENIPVKVNVVWGASIKDGNEDIKGKPIVSPPTPINTDKYSKRNYAPSNIKIQELGYKNKSIAEAYHAAKKDGSNPELVNAVEELLGGEEKKVKFSRKPIMTDVVNGFYSPLENAVAAVKQDKMPAKQWMKYTNMEEAKWTGLNDWLSQQPGSLTKGDILKYLKDNRIEIREEVKESKLTRQDAEKEGFKIEQRGDEWVAIAPNDSYDFIEISNSTLDALLSSLSEWGIEGKTSYTKYSEYQLGGNKDNYKEVLVTLPLSKEKKSFEDWVKDVYGETTEGWSDGMINAAKQQYESAITSEDWAGKQSATATKNVFKSSHFDEPNILVHLRMNTRTDTKGNKVLFLEEVQSDWGQTGREKGFAPSNVEELIDERNEIVKKYEKEFGGQNSVEFYKALSKDSRYNEVSKILNNTYIPTAPYVMNTSDWVKLGVKVALKEAEKQGADYIAWTTGEQQNERYDLSKQVNKIDVESVEAAEGLFYVDIELSSGDTEDFAVGDGIIRTGSYQGRRLEDVVGKEYAEKILSTPRGESVTLQGQDLKLGGKGMKSFYDKIVPDVAKAVIKDVTGTPGEITSVTIETDKGKSTQMAIAVTPEVKGAVKGGMAKFSRKKQDQKPPSVAKLLGITDKKIEIKEKTALANQLKAEARGARNAVKAWKDRAKLLADELKQLKGSNKINQSQYIAALRALVKVNIFNEDSISKFVDYVTKVINNAEYAKQITELRKALPVAKKNVDRKLGMQPNLQAVLKKVFAVSPSMIPDAVFDKYVNLVNMIGERARVLNLDEQSSIMADATAIATIVDHEQFLAQMLKDAFDNYRDKVLDSNGDVDYQKTIEKMVSDGIIQPSDIELMKKYKGVIVPKEPKTEAEIQAEAAEREQERQDFISSIPGQTVTPSNLSTPDEKAGAKELIELSKDEQVLERMTLEQLRNLDKVLDNIANGFYPAYAHTLKEVMNGIKSSEGVRKAMPKIKIPAIRSMIGKLKAALMKGENMYYHVLSKVPLYIIDQQLGNYKTSPIYKNIFEKVAIAQSKLASKQKQLLSQLDKAADAVFKEAKRNPDKARMSEYRIFTYLLHREFMSNPGAKGVADAVNFIKATIEYHEENGDTAQVNSRDVEMLQKILDQYESNGKLDFAKLERSLTPKERAYVDALDKVNNEVYPMAEYTASVLRGESVPMLNNYVHHRVLPSKKAVGEQPNELMKANQRMNPSSRSGSLISREPGVKPLNFKVFSTQKAAVNSVLVDRFMTEPIRTTRRMFESLKRSLKDDGMLRGHNRDIVAALEMAFEKANEALLTNNLMYDTFMDEVINSVTRDAYRALLARPTRAIIEYASNLSAALTKSTGAFIDGMSMKGAMSQEELGAFMYSVNSTQVSRVMPSSDMSSKFIDFGATGPAIGRQGSTANSSLANRMQTIYNRTLRRYKGGVDSVADALISTPDKAVSQPVWTGSFYNQFKKITGVNPDKDKIISGDEAYMERYKDAIKSATEKADEEVFMLSSVDNPYMGILNTLKSANDSPMRKAYKMFNNFLTRFQINDYVNARAAVNAMVNNGKMSKADGARLLVAITLRSVVYIALGKIAIEAMLSAIVDREPEEEDDRSYMEIAGNALASSMTTLMFGRSHGNLLRGIIGMGVEEINEEHLGFMRRGAYDPSRDAIQFGLIPKYSMDDSQGLGLWDVIKSMSGPFNPMLNTIDNALKAATKDLKEPDAVRRAEQTLMIRTPFELLGNIGLIPAYGDIRKIIVADINKGIGKKAKPKEPTWRELPKSERAEIRRLDPKAADEMIKEQKEIDRINKMIRKQEQRYR